MPTPEPGKPAPKPRPPGRLAFMLRVAYINFKSSLSSVTGIFSGGESIGHQPRMVNKRFVTLLSLTLIVLIGGGAAIYFSEGSQESLTGGAEDDDATDQFTIDDLLKKDYLLKQNVHSGWQKPGLERNKMLDSPVVEIMSAQTERLDIADQLDAHPEADSETRDAAELIRLDCLTEILLREFSIRISDDNHRNRLFEIASKHEHSPNPQLAMSAALAKLVAEQVMLIQEHEESSVERTSLALESAIKSVDTTPEGFTLLLRMTSILKKYGVDPYRATLMARGGTALKNCSSPRLRSLGPEMYDSSVHGTVDVASLINRLAFDDSVLAECDDYVARSAMDLNLSASAYLTTVELIEHMARQGYDDESVAAYKTLLAAQPNVKEKVASETLGSSLEGFRQRRQLLTKKIDLVAIKNGIEEAIQILGEGPTLIVFLDVSKDTQEVMSAINTITSGNTKPVRIVIASVRKPLSPQLETRMESAIGRISGTNKGKIVFLKFESATPLLNQCHSVFPPYVVIIDSEQTVQFENVRFEDIRECLASFGT